MNIGYFLKKIRTDKSLTLSDVANKTNMTASLISQIENEKIYPSLNSLEAILHYYGIELSDFFEQAEKKSCFITRHGDAPRVKSTMQADISALNPLLYELGPEWFNVEIAAEGRLEIKKGIENIGEMRFIFLISGEITVEFGNVKFNMAPEDTLCFKSFLPVVIMNSNKSKAKLILSGKQLVII
ncbi:MAG TPA: helix-turn-helix domain-containing protein [Candidatus Wallbacteria bacterium]|nr:helix-turn-helix domain-containing protein [Candidatus Wallbacteria bacterium]